MSYEVPHRNLPFELVEPIIVEAWRSLTPPEANTYAFTQTARYERYRAHFLGTVSSVCRTWRQIILDVAFRFVVVHTQGDVDMYKQLVLRFLGKSGLIGSEIAQAHRAFFARSHVSVHIRNRWFRGSEPGDKGRLHPPNMHSPIVWQDADGKEICLPVIPDGRIVEIYGNYGSQWMWIKQLQFTTSAFLLKFPLSHSSYMDPTTRKTQLMFRSRFAITEFLKGVPRLTHLTVDYGLTLMRILGSTPHPNLRCLTLKTTPSPSGLTELGPWCIERALEGGLLCAQETRSHERTIVILGGNELEKKGWLEAQAACRKHGVELENIAIY